MIELELGKRYAVTDGTHTIICECEDNDGRLGLRPVPSFCSGFFAIHGEWFPAAKITDYEFATIYALID